MHTILQDRNKGLKAEAIGFAQELIRTSSLSGAEGPVARLVAEKLRALNYDKVFQDDCGNVIGVCLGLEAGPTVVLNCHMDTAEAGNDWSEPVLSGTLADGKLHGLGAADCKGGLAAQVFAGALLKRSLLPLRGNLVVAATVSEETGGSVGVRHVAEKTLPQLELKPTYAVLGEPTDLGLYYGHDGWFEADVVVEGANPFHVDDAARAIFEEFDPEASGRGSDASNEVAVSLPRFEDRGGLRCAKIGVARRLRPSENVQEAVGKLKRNAALATQAVAAVAVEVHLCEENQPMYNGRSTLVRKIVNSWATDPFDPLMERARHALSAAGCGVRPGRFLLGRLGMGTAGGTLLEQYRVPTVAYGPGNEEQAHARNEWVETKKITEAIYGTACIVHSLIGVPVYGWGSEDI